jgi:hypothetical protein
MLTVSHPQNPPTTRPYKGRPAADSLPGGGTPRGDPSPQPPGFPRGFPPHPLSFPLPAHPTLHRWSGTRAARNTTPAQTDNQLAVAPGATGTSARTVPRIRPRATNTDVRSRSRRDQVGCRLIGSGSSRCCGLDGHENMGSCNAEVDRPVRSSAETASQLVETPGVTCSAATGWPAIDRMSKNKGGAIKSSRPRPLLTLESTFYTASYWDDSVFPGRASTTPARSLPQSPLRLESARSPQRRDKQQK